MKGIRNLLILFYVILCCQCQNEMDIPERTDCRITTYPASDVGNTSASISFMIEGVNYYNNVKKGLFLSDMANLDNPDVLEGQNVTARNLKAGTTYYYQGFVEDRLGNQIKGEILSFTTKNEPFSITTGNYYQLSSEYKYQGFEGSNRYKYNYRYGIKLYATLVNAENVESWGIVWFDTYYNLNTDANKVKEGTLYDNFYLLANSYYGDFTYKAYAKLKNGTYIYGKAVTGTFVSKNY